VKGNVFSEAQVTPITGLPNASSSALTHASHVAVVSDSRDQE